GAGVMIKARSDAPSYSGNPATLNGVTVENNFIENNQTGLRFGEPAKNNPGPTGVQVHSNSIQGNTVNGLNVQSLATVDATSNWWGTNNGPANPGNTYNIGAHGNAVTGP